MKNALISSQTALKPALVMKLLSWKYYDRFWVFLIISSKIIYEIVPEITYSGKELFESEELSLFTNINDNESYYDLIIVGKKILKNQIDHNQYLSVFLD